MDEKELSSIRQKMESYPRWPLTLLAFILGLGISTFIVFQVLFLAKVLPHGGL